MEGRGQEGGVDHQLAATLEQEKGARYAAFHDVLTGLPNRALFNDRLEHGIAQAKRHGWTLAVMFVDLDKFKSINDTYGHDAGDIVLQTTARRLKENTRGDDTVSRHGGDNFVMLTEIHTKDNMIAEKIGDVIHATSACRDPNYLHRGSIGISIFPKNGTNADSWLNVRRGDMGPNRTSPGIHLNGRAALYAERQTPGRVSSGICSTSF
jgi:diguanylate cyclase (GGDEF)-like protein